MDIEDMLVAAERGAVLGFMAAAINELTVVGRGAYAAHAVDVSPSLETVNEAIHRISGHLRDLCDPQEALTESRARGIAEALGLLGFHARSRLLSHWFL